MTRTAKPKTVDYAVCADIHHDKTDYRPGDTITLSPDDSVTKALLGQGKIKPPQADEPKAESAKE